MNYSLLEEQADRFLDDDDAKELAQVEIGKRDELEHTNDPEVALRITLQHLAEDPDYYFKLKPASNRAGYQIDLIAIATWTEELIHIRLVSNDRGAEWYIESVNVLRENQVIMYVSDAIANIVADSMGKTYYECNIGKYNTAFTNDTYWFRLMELAGGFNGSHMGIKITTTPADFLNAIERTCVLDKRISLF